MHVTENTLTVSGDVPLTVSPVLRFDTAIFVLPYLGMFLCRLFPAPPRQVCPSTWCSRISHQQGFLLDYRRVSAPAFTILALLKKNTASVERVGGRKTVYRSDKIFADASAFSEQCGEWR